MDKPCVWCWYARDRKDIAGVYCTGGVENRNGQCDKYTDYRAEKHRRRKTTRGEKLDGQAQN